METIAVWFSCGCASAVAAKLTIEKYGVTHHIRLLNNEVIEEGDDNRRFLADVSDWLQWPIEQVVNPKYPHCSAEQVWDQRGYMSGIHGAPCTYHLKKEARQLWERDNHVDWHVMGFCFDERARHNAFVLSERDNVLPVLIDAALTKQACFEVIAGLGFDIPLAYRKGYLNANCPGCVKATSPTYWNHVRNVDPDVFASRAAQSRRLGVRLVRHKGQRVYLDELPADAKGRPMKALQMPDCGIFCEPSKAMVAKAARP